MINAGHGIDLVLIWNSKSLPNSFNAELLHDYENGTFTPNIQYDTGSLVIHFKCTGRLSYIRIGDLVNFGHENGLV